MVLLRSAFALLAACFAIGPQWLMAETVLLDFSSPTCGPCRQMRPTIQRLAAAGHAIREIDISREPQSAARWQVTQVPTFIVLVDGRETARLEGGTSYQRLERLLAEGGTSPAGNSPVADRGTTPQTFAPTATANSLSSPQPGRIAAIQPPANPFDSPGRQPFPPSVGSPSASQDLQRRLIEATVRLSIKDAEGTSSGTGTLVDSRQGEALVLTCGHIFRSSQGKGPIRVTLFQVGPDGVIERITVAGQLQDFDLERDLALVSIRIDVPIRAVAVAPAGTQLSPNAQVTSVGCNHGQLPTAVISQVTSNDRYQGPPNVEVAGAPVEGRSGGGLFNNQGQLVGVCFAADPQANEGLYAAASSVHAKLDSLGMAVVYQSPSLGAPGMEPSREEPYQFAATPSANSPLDAFQVEPVNARGQDTATPPRMTTPPPMQPATFQLAAAEQAALDEIQRRGTHSEVICIIRPQSPDGKSEVITLQNASPEFIRALTQPATAAAKEQLFR